MATFANPDFGHLRRYYFGAQEATFGAGGALSHVGHSALDGPPLKRTANRLSNRSFSAGTVRTDQETAHIITDYQLDGTVPLMPSLELFAYLLGKILGNDTKAAVSTLWGHTMTPPDVPDYLPSFPIEQHLAGPSAQADTDFKFLGCQANSLSLSWGEVGMAKMSLGVAGSGAVEAAGLVTESGLVVPASYIFPKNIRTWIKAATTEHASAWDGTHEVSATAGDFPTINTGALNLSAHIVEAELRVLANLGSPRQGQHFVDAGQYRCQLLPQDRVYAMDLTLRTDDSTRALLKALELSTAADQNEYTLGLEIAGFTAGHGMQIIFSLCAPPDADPGSGEGELRNKYTFVARKVSAGTDRPIVSAYAVNADNIDYGTM